MAGDCVLSFLGCGVYPALSDSGLSRTLSTALSSGTAQIPGGSRSSPHLRGLGTGGLQGWAAGERKCSTLSPLKCPAWGGRGVTVRGRLGGRRAGTVTRLCPSSLTFPGRGLCSSCAEPLASPGTPQAPPETPCALPPAPPGLGTLLSCSLSGAPWPHCQPNSSTYRLQEENIPLSHSACSFCA